MISLTYGHLPTFEDFESAFDIACPNNDYRIKLSQSDARACDDFTLGDGEWRCSELWQALNEIHETWLESDMDDNSIDAAMDIVSSILYTLGFEWI